MLTENSRTRALHGRLSMSMQSTAIPRLLLDVALVLLVLYAAVVL